MEHQKTSTGEQFLNIFVLQVIAVAIFIIFAICIKIYGGQLYAEISNEYHKAFDDTTNAYEVLEDNGGNSVIESNNAEKTIPTSADFDNCNYVLDFSAVRDNIGMSKTDKNVLKWPIVGKITSEYGYRNHPITDKYSLHGGIDISGNTGDEILCAMDGTVSDSGYSDSYGYYAIIDHGNNMQTVYAHCSKIIAQENDIVKQGNIIAKVGSTGTSTGPHLHFEVRVGNSRINPRWMLGEMTSI